jgi:hypothetical protein
LGSKNFTQSQKIKLAATVPMRAAMPISNIPEPLSVAAEAQGLR